MISKSEVALCLDRVEQTDWSAEWLDSIENLRIETETDAVHLIRVLQSLQRRGWTLVCFPSPLHRLMKLVLECTDDAALIRLRREAVPVLRLFLLDELNRIQSGRPARGQSEQWIYESDLGLVLYTLLLFMFPEDMKLLARALHTGFLSNVSCWPDILSMLEAHPCVTDFFDGVRGFIPGNYCVDEFLALGNRLVLDKRLQEHPFDYPAGHARLRAWLNGELRGAGEIAVSAGTAVPFLGEPVRTELTELAQHHENQEVRLGFAWAQACAGDRAGVFRLLSMARDLVTSAQAVEYLEQLGEQHRIPAEVSSPEFVAQAKMTSWLARSSVYGRVPDKITVVDRRELFWPPAGEVRTMWLLRYEYSSFGYGLLSAGIGCVGSETWASIGIATVDKRHEDLYGWYCAGEYYGEKFRGESTDATIETGKSLIREYNPDFD